jgi:hypothetical protein
MEEPELTRAYELGVNAYVATPVDSLPSWLLRLL